jgi:anhydro-N-acetylmuramic acid kinase
VFDSFCFFRRLLRDSYQDFGSLKSETMPRAALDVLQRIMTKDTRLICGIMSGTSVDAVDVALVRISGGGLGTRLDVVAYTETYYPEEVQQMIFSNAEASTSNVNDICILHTALAHVYADAVRELCEEAGLPVHAVDLIGMHGQTIHHLPEPTQLGRHLVRSSLQIGSGPTLATLLGVPVLSDFRAPDLALGGQGAPLVPYVDYLLFRSTLEHRALVNIGGIANLTWLPANCAEEDVVAFDSGPGNMIVDALIRRLYGREFDEGGAIARSGRVNGDLLSWMLGHEFFRMPPPKSAGRELFGTEYVGNLLQIAYELDVSTPADIIATASECTVRTVTSALLSVTPPQTPFSLFLSGGGARNEFFREGLAFSVPQARQSDLTDLGLSSDAKEAVSFAILANEWLNGNAANLPRVTGATGKALLGSLSIGV